MREILRSKIHNARVTESNLNYIGSITIDETLMELSDLKEGEKVLVVSSNTGVRLETYVILGKRDSGVICINGPAAHLIKKDEIVIIMGFEITTKDIVPKKIQVDKNNKFLNFL